MPHAEVLEIVWWAPRESNTAPTDYESAALTKHELGAQNCCDQFSPYCNGQLPNRRGRSGHADGTFRINYPRGNSSACPSARDGAACAMPSLRFAEYVRE